MSEDLRRQLLEIIRTQGVRRLPEAVQLASGEWSADFVDGKEALQRWSDLELACRAIVSTVEEAGLGFDAAGGPTMGADALAVGIACVTDSRWFFVRKEPKQRGTRRMIEGAQIGSGDRVLLVEDVVSTGGSCLAARDAIVATGAEVVAAATLVDRGDAARPRFERAGVPLFAMATYADLGIEPIGGPAPAPS